MPEIIDLVELRRLSERLDHLTESNRALTHRLGAVEPRMASTEGRLDLLYLSSTTMDRKLDIVIADLNAVRSEVGELAEKVGHIEGAVLTLQSDVTTLQSDVTALKSDVATLKSDVATLKSDVADIKGDMPSMRGMLAEILTRLPPATH